MLDLRAYKRGLKNPMVDFPKMESQFSEVRGLTLNFSVSVNQCNHGAENRGGSGSSGNLVVISANNHVVGISEGSNVRVGTTSGVEHGGRRKVSSSVQVVLDSGSLVTEAKGSVHATGTKKKKMQPLVGWFVRFVAVVGRFQD